VRSHWQKQRGAPGWSGRRLMRRRRSQHDNLHELRDACSHHPQGIQKLDSQSPGRSDMPQVRALSYHKTHLAGALSNPMPETVRVRALPTNVVFPMHNNRDGLQN